MNFKWYKIINSSDDITQGDIIGNCPIPIPNVAIYKAIVEEKNEVDEPIEIKEADVIILSQACDIENEKVESLVMCPVWALKVLVNANEYFKSSNSRESLRQGKEPSYHLLNKYESKRICLDYSVVDFHQIYSAPKLFLKTFVNKQKNRLRLLPPYREHLSQAFARYFMRVGLPLDINKDSIKKYLDNNSIAL